MKAREKAPSLSTSEKKSNAKEGEERKDMTKRNLKTEMGSSLRIIFEVKLARKVGRKRILS